MCSSDSCTIYLYNYMGIILILQVAFTIIQYMNNTTTMSRYCYIWKEKQPVFLLSVVAYSELSLTGIYV